MEIEQTNLSKIRVDVSDESWICIYQDIDLIILDRSKIQELIEVLKSEVTE